MSAANLYYAQPLLGTLSVAFGSSHGATALAVTLTQIGYAAGLVLLVPLGDRMENRRLATRTLLVTALALAGLAASPTLPVFLVLALAVGATSVVAQMLVPLAAHLAPDARRGQIVGRVMSGLLLGILLARTVSSLLAAALGWRRVYGLSAVFMVALSLVLARVLPERRPVEPLPYRALIRSVGTILREEPALRRRAAYQVAMFGAFSVFWTTIGYELSARGVSQTGIGLFALVGAAGALAAPVAGRLADRGYSRPATGGAFVLAVVAMLLATGLSSSLLALGAAGVLLDLGVQTALVVGQRTIYALRPAARSRLNTAFMATFFLGGAAASALGGAVFGSWGWTGSALLAAALPLAGLLFWTTERGTDHGPRSAAGTTAMPSRRR